MSNIQQLLIDHIAIWTAADTAKKSGRGRSSNNVASVYGIKKLRELILELAVRGKLMPQDPNDEAASELLKRIQTKIKTIPDEQYPFVLPQGWKWIKFGDVLDFQGGGQPPKHAFSKTKLDGYVQLIQIRDLGESPQPVYIKKELATKFCTPNDIMIGRYGASVGKVFWGKDGAYNVALVKIIDEFNIYYSRFLFEFFRSPHGQSFFSGIARSAQAGFNKNDIQDQLMPICSHAEQHRIVTKVDELMALCDQLETQHNNTTEAHEKLVSHLLGTLTQSQSAKEFSENWQRIAAHFDILFTTEESIDTLKQTLLQLAVIGKLVPQDPNDEPASELLKRMKAGKSDKNRRDKVLELVTTNKEKYSELPNGWQWVSLSEISQVGTGATPLRTKPEYFNPGIISWVTSGETSNPFIFKTEQYVSPLALNETNLTVYPKGTLIVAMYGQGKTRGQVTELMLEACTNQACAAIRLSNTNDCHRKYVKLFFEKIYDEIRELAAGGAQPNLNLNKIKETLLPLPPLAEQHRIVDKINELVASCNKLKNRINKVNQLQQKLADVVVEQALI